MQTFSQFLRIEFAPPSYLLLPAAGVEISISGIKAAFITERGRGLELTRSAEFPFPQGVIENGEIADRAKLIEGLKALAGKHKFSFVNVALPESRGYLFEAEVDGTEPAAWRTAVESKLDEYVPLPPAEVVFDIAPLPRREGRKQHVVGVAYARRVVDETLAMVEEAGMRVTALESETFALPRAVLPQDSAETVLIVDLGRTTTKLLVVTSRLPRLVTTMDIGGHALTLAVEKYFGVSEEEAKRVKAERGIALDAGNEEYIAAMISTVSVIRDEIQKRLSYWHTSEAGVCDPVTRILLVGGNASVRGLPEYLAASLSMPVALGDTFTRLAPRKFWHAPLTDTEALAYGTTLGLALRHYEF